YFPKRSTISYSLAEVNCLKYGYRDRYHDYVLNVFPKISIVQKIDVIVQRRPAILSIDEDNATSDQVTYSLNYTL
ncbi:hypothetical protein P5673_020155, partial [Acropora cervicornis]